MRPVLWRLCGLPLPAERGQRARAAHAEGPPPRLTGICQQSASQDGYRLACFECWLSGVAGGKGRGALQDASHQLVMITGDTPLTACHAAKQVHIVDRPVLILDSYRSASPARLHASSGALPCIVPLGLACIFWRPPMHQTPRSSGTTFTGHTCNPPFSSSHRLAGARRSMRVRPNVACGGIKINTATVQGFWQRSRDWRQGSHRWERKQLQLSPGVVEACVASKPDKMAKCGMLLLQCLIIARESDCQWGCKQQRLSL